MKMVLRAFSKMIIITDDRQLYIQEKSIPVTESGCWIWLDYVDPSGYGRLTYQYKKLYAHRHSYEAFIGEIPNGLHVLHKCDNPSCVNPEHLFLGTDQDNVDDREKKKRGVFLKGEDKGNSKLTENKVLEIREKYAFYKYSQYKLAKEYDVHPSQIHRVINNKTWKHI